MFFYLLNTVTLIYGPLHKTPFLREGNKEQVVDLVISHKNRQAFNNMKIGSKT